MAAPTPIDPRGPRFGAGITVVVLAAALILGPTWGLPLLVIQTVAFAAGAVLGVHRQPYALLYKTLIQPQPRFRRTTRVTRRVPSR